MPALEVHDCHQDAVLWVRTGQNRYGRPITANPVGVKVRWIWTKKEVTDSTGNTVAIDAVAVVKQSIAIGSLMWLGKLADLPTPPVDVMQVISAPETSDIKNRFVRRTVNLARYSDSLPPA